MGVGVCGTVVASRTRERAQFAARPANNDDDGDNAEAGFTLFEALVALALLMGFVAVLGPQLSYGRRIMAHAEGRVAAQVLLRALLDAPFDRSALADAAREGGVGALRWRIVTEPAASAPVSRNWSAYRVTASVAWGEGQVIEAQTIRLARPPQ